MDPTQPPNTETFLAEQLAAKLKVLETVTTTAAVGLFDVRVSVVDLNARASGPGLAAIEQGIAWVLQQELDVVIKSLVAQKRHDVDKARKDLLDYQFRTLQPDSEKPLAMTEPLERVEFLPDPPPIPEPAPYAVAIQNHHAAVYGVETATFATNGEDKSEARPAPIKAEILGEEITF